MGLDTTRLGRVAAEMMESLAESYAEEDVEMGEVVLAVEIRSGGWSGIAYRCTDPRNWVQRGLALGLKRAIKRNGRIKD